MISLLNCNKYELLIIIEREKEGEKQRDRKPTQKWSFFFLYHRYKMMEEDYARRCPAGRKPLDVKDGDGERDSGIASMYGRDSTRE